MQLENGLQEMCECEDSWYTECQSNSSLRKWIAVILLHPNHALDPRTYLKATVNEWLAGTPNFGLPRNLIMLFYIMKYDGPILKEGLVRSCMYQILSCMGMKESSDTLRCFQNQEMLSDRSEKTSGTKYTHRICGRIILDEAGYGA